MITYKPAIYQSNPYLLKMRLFLIVEGYLEYPYLNFSWFLQANVGLGWFLWGIIL
tara:strand:- start:3413 stop:3577 length:165 start_codon:yes stop_codon:yes gene_type:complete